MKKRVSIVIVLLVLAAAALSAQTAAPAAQSSDMWKYLAAAIAVGARARPDSNVAAATSPPATARTDCADTWKLIVLLIE